MGVTRQKRLTRDESRAKTRADLLRAARFRFAKHGYEGTSVEQVAEDAGYSRGAMHYNFKSKEELFVEVLRDCFGEDLRGLEALIEAHQGDAVEVAAAVFRASAQEPDSYLLRLEFWLRALRDEGFRPVYLAEHRRYREALVERTQQRLQPGKAAEFAALTMGLHNGLELVHLLDPPALSLEAYRRVLEQIFPAYLKP